MQSLPQHPDADARLKMLGDSRPANWEREAVEADRLEVQAESVRRALVFARNVSERDLFDLAEHIAANRGEPLVPTLHRVKEYHAETLAWLERLASRYGVCT